MSTPGKPPPRYAPALRRGIHEVSHQVEAMHRAIATKAFGALKRVPVVAQPAALVERLHDAISGSVHAAVRVGSHSLLGLAGHAERALASDGPPGRRERTLRAAINGVFGDQLAAHGEALATPMQVIARHAHAPLDPATLDLPHGRVAIFLHGLACDESCWLPDDGSEDPDYATGIAAGFGHVPLYLRYNSGLPIADNARAFAAEMAALVTARPDIDDILLVGHSMGGLIARCALREAGTAAWVARVSMLISLGSPQLGSPLERLGAITNRALNSFTVTAPIGAIAARRSAGIRDLHDGIGDAADSDPPHVEYRFLGATLADDADSPLGRWVGDGLVTPDSALAEAPRANVARAHLGGMGHMRLLHDARAWTQIRAWLGEACPPAA